MAADGSAPARAAGTGRLQAVRQDFFLDPGQRLTEQERALMTAMLRGLIRDVASAIRAALPRGRLPANDDGDASLIARLTSSKLVDEPHLMALLLRRADEERIATAARARSARREARVLQGFVSDNDGGVAAAAMAVILAKGRRRDRFGQYLILFDDLAQTSAESLVHAIAAALRAELAEREGLTGADLELTHASRQVLEHRDERRGINALIAALVDVLEATGTLTDELVVAAANEGEVAFVAEILSRRGGLSGEASIDELLSADPKRLMTLLRISQSSRNLAAGLLGSIGDLLGVDDAGAALAMFENMPDTEVQGVRAWLLTAPSYKAALEQLGPSRG
ncbi:MAG TPA: hypothetical protein VE968_02725 [Sphingomicrobium sp.]|nr:hypothetical protein [Sphingomicrobium sp.]